MKYWDMRCAPALPSVFHLLLKFNPPAKEEAQSGAGNVCSGVLCSAAGKQIPKFGLGTGPCSSTPCSAPLAGGIPPSPMASSACWQSEEKCLEQFVMVRLCQILAEQHTQSFPLSTGMQHRASVPSSTHRAVLTTPQGRAQSSLLPGLRALPGAQLHWESRARCWESPSIQTHGSSPAGLCGGPTAVWELLAHISESPSGIAVELLRDSMMRWHFPTMLPPHTRPGMGLALLYPCPGPHCPPHAPPALLALSSAPRLLLTPAALSI